MIETLVENKNTVLYVTSKRLGKEGQFIVPSKGDLGSETKGCIVFYDHAQRGWNFASPSGEFIVKDYHEAESAYNAYCIDPANNYQTLVEVDPSNGKERILRVVVVQASPNTNGDLKLTIFSWALLAVAFILFLNFFRASYLSNGSQSPRTWHKQRRIHFDQH